MSFLTLHYRFTGVRKYKEVNPNWAVHMVAEDPIVMVHGNHTTCSGGLGAALGHPKVITKEHSNRGY